jgi:hypothetical protein
VRWTTPIINNGIAPLLLGIALLLTGCQGDGKTRNPSSLTPRLEIPFVAASSIPQVTGDPDDPAWSHAATIGHLGLAVDPPADVPAHLQPLPTKVQLLWDADWLYIRFRNLGARPEAPFGDQRDGLHYKGDAVEVFLDPAGDGRQYFEFQQSPAGGLLDQNTLLTADARSDAEGRLVEAVRERDYWPNLGYDMPGVRVASRSVQQQDGQWLWVADFALPARQVLKRVGRTQFGPMAMRINLVRYDWTGEFETSSRRLIPMNWSPVTWGCPHQSPAAMGTIELVK